MHHTFCTFFSRRCTTTTWNQEPKISRFLFLHLDTVLPDSTSENFPNKINEQMNWNWIRSTKFERVRIHFCDVFGLLSFRNFATMATLSLRRKIILHFLSPPFRLLCHAFYFICGLLLLLKPFCGTKCFAKVAKNCRYFEGTAFSLNWSTSDEI